MTWAYRKRNMPMSPTAPETKPEVKTVSATASAAFEKALSSFIRSTKESMDTARKCAEMGLQHFADHGNTIWLQRFYDVMPQNWTRKQAFLKWLASHAPITMKDKKFVKDTAENASTLDLEGAFKKPFWDFAPEMPIIDFTTEDLNKALVSLVKRFQGTKRYAPADEQATLQLKKLEGFVVGFTGEPIPTNENVSEAPAPQAVSSAA